MDIHHPKKGKQNTYTRRAALGALGATAASLAALRLPQVFGASGEGSSASAPTGAPVPPKETYETQAKGIRILPGQWRPHYPWEQIAWISPSWPSQDYLWLDFPEAIFTSQGLLFLSHINPGIETVFSDLPKVAWQQNPDGISFDRELPNGSAFGGRIVKSSDTTVDLELHLHNGSSEKLADITLQTCAFLRGIKEFADYTRDNKFVHVPNDGWIPMTKAVELPDGAEPYRLGWRTKGKRVADVPMVVTVSNQADRLFAFTWQEHTLSMIGNPHHPCAHADPQFPDLNPGETASIHGKLVFFEGKLQDFDYRQYTVKGA